MMKKTVLSTLFVLMAFIAMSQKLTTTTGVISFDATTDKDKLPKAENRAVIGSLDKKTGAIAFEAAVNNFSFSNPTMHTHFNSERWLNSMAFPKFSFSGKLDKLATVKFTRNGTYSTTATGDLSIKGVTKKITVPVTLVVNNGKISGSSAFSVTLADYGIAGQTQIESGKVNKVVKVNVSASF